MAKRMLIDATHHEETRVVVMDGNKLVEFDYESQFRRQLKGNIFLAKVTRVEPSLQAAFVNFGGNRHGFLPFAEIHPDYYRIPVADREALLAEQQAMEEEAAAREAEEEAREDAEYAAREAQADAPHEMLDDATGPTDFVDDETDDIIEDVSVDTSGDDTLADFAAPEDAATNAEEHDDDVIEQPDADATDAGDDEAVPEGEVIADTEIVEGEPGEGGRGGRSRGWRNGRRGGGNNNGRRSMGARRNRDEVSEEGPAGLHARFRRRYKIQEVIKRGQIMLIQVSKEERGNKGAAVTTYLSLPGRYCVLMPNSPRGGGVSRKIGNFADRRRLKDMLRMLEIPSGMSVILRTAGVERTEAEIKRDYDYLLRLWDNIREMTLQSTAPALIYEEGDLIKRSIRDIYSRDVDELLVSGERGFNEARDFMGMLMPNHVERVQHYANDKIPLFHRYQVESQITEIGEPVVQLKSGGYLVINQTEALVAVDVNSGRATKERHIEETALKTNLEAAEEVARQLRLRDLGGLVVIDFIDMEDRRNNAKVERKLKDALASDRARIQVSRISTFGLLELSRQRLNPSLTEAQFTKCSHCAGFGFIRSVDSAAILALRSLEDEGIRARTNRVTLHIPNAIALYILNDKRDMLAAIEARYGFKVMIHVDDSLAPSGYKVEAMKNDVPQDDDAGDDDDNAQEQPRNNARGRARGKPVLMEQALEEQAETEENDISGNVIESEPDDVNFNRSDVEPDGEQPRNRSNGDRNGRTGRNRGGRNRNRGRDRDDGGQLADRPVRQPDNQNSDQPPRERGERNDRGGRNRNRNRNRGPRRSDDTGENGAQVAPGQDNGDQTSYDMPAAVASVSAPIVAEKPRATYFVSKPRRSADVPDEQGVTAPAPVTITEGPPENPNTPKKKGWWGNK